MAEESKKCLVGLKHGVNQSGYSNGYVFESIEPCCERFKIFFLFTGNPKVPSFNRYHHEDSKRAGCQLGTLLGGQMVVSFYFVTGANVAFSEKLDYCPFCSAPIEIKTVKKVELVPKMKQVPDGYDERPL